MTTAMRRWLTALLATAVMALALFWTSNALRDAGPWAGTRPVRHGPAADPYERLDRLIAATGRDILPSTMRDPFGYGTVAPAPGATHTAPRRKPPPAPPVPRLTAVVTDPADVQAVIEDRGHAYTVRVGSMFGEHGEYKVISITDSVVVIESGGKQINLYMGSKGK